MKRVCLIGNSHLGCFKLGWETIKNQYPDVEITWFGAGGARWDLELNAGCLVPREERARDGFSLTSGGKTEIDPSIYDAFVLVGLRLDIRRVVELALVYKPHRIKSVQSDHIVSDELFKTALRIRFDRTPAIRFARLLRKSTDRQIVVCPTPMPSDRIVDTRASFAPFQHDDAGEQLASLFRAAAADCVREAAADLVWQPECILVHGIFTPHKFSVGSKRLLAETHHEEDDFHHMNADFGEIQLENILLHLGLIKALAPVGGERHGSLADADRWSAPKSCPGVTT